MLNKQSVLCESSNQHNCAKSLSTRQPVWGWLWVTGVELRPEAYGTRSAAEESLDHLHGDRNLNRVQILLGDIKIA
jgi:hypothetical protein